jgi:hypothetical protein
MECNLKKHILYDKTYNPIKTDNNTTTKMEKNEVYNHASVLEIITSVETLDTKTTDDTTISEILDAKDVKFTTKEKYYFKAVDKFYRKHGKKYMKLMVDIIEGKSNISLRSIDWFTTRYANKKKISYYLKHESSDDEILTNGKFKFPVHISYKAQLRAYKKRYFDPFRRKKKFYYAYNVNGIKKKLFTTIGQLNFFMWAFENEVIDHIIENYSKINKEMIKSNKDDKLRKQKDKLNKATLLELQKDERKSSAGVVADKVFINKKLEITLSFD